MEIKTFEKACELHAEILKKEKLLEGLEKKLKEGVEEYRLYSDTYISASNMEAAVVQEKKDVKMELERLRKEFAELKDH